MNYEDMSDFEINKCVAEAAGMELSSDHSGAYVGVVRRSIGSRPNYGHVNYCSNPSDAWPIIMEYQISITKYEGLEEWGAHGGGICVDYDHCIISDSDCSYSNKNPLRAAMIVFLMMRESTCQKT